MNPLNMTDIPIEDLNEHRYWQPQWQVELCHGEPESSAVIVDTVHVTKKWERVEAAIENFRLKSLNLPQHEHGQWFVQVYEVAYVAYGVHTFPEPTNEELENAWRNYVSE